GGGAAGRARGVGRLPALAQDRSHPRCVRGGALAILCGVAAEGVGRAPLHREDARVERLLPATPVRALPARAARPHLPGWAELRGIDGSGEASPGKGVRLREDVPPLGFGDAGDRRRLETWPAPDRDARSLRRSPPALRR